MSRKLFQEIQLDTNWHHQLVLKVSIELVSSPARVTSVKFQQGQLETLGPQVYLGPIKMSSEMEVALPP